MTAVQVEITARPPDDPAPPTEIELVEDMDEIVESSMCSCNAGDDNPY